MITIWFQSFTEKINYVYDLIQILSLNWFKIIKFYIRIILINKLEHS